MKNGRTIIAAQRALEILKTLMDRELTVDEILESFSADSEYEPIYSKEAIYKYFNTFKSIGIEIKKENGKYFTDKIFENINLSQEDVMILSFLENYIKSTQQEVTYNKFLNIKEKIYKNNISVVENIINLNYEQIFKTNAKYKKCKKLIANLEEYCLSKQQLNLIYKTDDKEFSDYIIVAENILYEKGVLKLKAYCIKTFEYKNFAIENIEKIDVLPLKNSSNFYLKTAIFKLKDALAINYKLKVGETIKEQKDNYIVIMNNYQNYNDLLKRLLRYGDKCEVIYPLVLREDMTSMIKRALDLYK
ncbi:WYL domain-containing protein [bacterium]|nr:WYL domain-containing protein [bacterium]